MKKTAPSVDMRPVVSVQPSKSIPIWLSAPAPSPSVMPTVSHESAAALASSATNAGLIPPTLALYGALAWYAAGIVRGEAIVPKMLYTFVAPLLSDAVSRYVS